MLLLTTAYHTVKYFNYTIETICNFFMKFVSLCKQLVKVCGCDICCGEWLCEEEKHIWPQRNNFVNHACCILIVILSSQYNK